MISTFKSGVAGYNQLLINKPIVTSLVSAAGIFGLGDTLCQVFFPHKKRKYGEKMKFDWNRLNSAVIVGVLLRCPSALIVIVCEKMYVQIQPSHIIYI